MIEFLCFLVGILLGFAAGGVLMAQKIKADAETGMLSIGNSAWETKKIVPSFDAGGERLPGHRPPFPGNSDVEN